MIGNEVLSVYLPVLCAVGGMTHHNEVDQHILKGTVVIACRRCLASSHANGPARAGPGPGPALV